MSSFTRVYFDTNVLIAANWPQPSAALENVLTLARVFKFGVFLPKAVEDELEQHWKRLFDEKHTKFRKAIADLTRHSSESEINLDDLVLVKKDAALAAYRARTEALKTRWDIETVPLTSRPVDELLRMAICGEPPFEKKMLDSRMQ